MNITDLRRSSAAVVLGTASSATSWNGVAISSNTQITPGWGIVALTSNTAAWRDVFSFGSNTNDVGSVGTMGASSSNSRADHVHRGLRSLSHTSNTYFGDITLVAGANIGILSSASNSFTIVGSAGGGSSGVTQEYAGYNTVGGSFETVTLRRHYMKTITLAQACMVSTVGAYVGTSGGGSVEGLQSFVMADVAGTPNQMVSYNFGSTNLFFYPQGAGDYRWVDLPIGIWLTAGTYWIGVVVFRSGGATALQIAYDSGADKISTATGDWLHDGNAAAVSDSGRKYSIRANTIR